MCFVPGAEINAYFCDVAQRHGLAAITRFGEEVTSCLRENGRWQLRTESGVRDVVDVVLACSGVLHHPNTPSFEGLDQFRGSAFHSARWDHGVGLEGRRVGVIGNGSTGVQLTSALAGWTAEFSLFQRTPQWILHQDNPPYSDEERARFRRDPDFMAQVRSDWSKIFTGGFADALVDADSPQMQFLEDLCRKNLEEKVRDPALKERLRPTYRAACKRLVLSPDFYEAVQRPGAHLVTEGIVRIVPEGVLTDDGRVHELDVLVLATGFRVDRFIRPTTVVGDGGVELDEVWADGPVAYLSIGVPGFPNFFFLNGPNGPVGNFSLIEVAELQIGYLVQLLAPLRDGRAWAIARARRPPPASSVYAALPPGQPSG